MNDDRAYWRSTCDFGVAELRLPRKLSIGDAADLKSLALLIERYVDRCVTEDTGLPSLLDCKGIIKADSTD